jgi:hypothetical protein
MLCGILIAGATVKEVVARIAASPVAITPKRPSIGAVMVMGFSPEGRHWPDRQRRLGGSRQVGDPAA